MSLDLQALETSFDLVGPRGDELWDTSYARMSAPGVYPLLAGTDLRRLGYERASAAAFDVAA